MQITALNHAKSNNCYHQMQKSSNNISFGTWDDWNESKNPLSTDFGAKTTGNSDYEKICEKIRPERDRKLIRGYECEKRDCYEREVWDNYLTCNVYGPPKWAREKMAKHKNEHPDSCNSGLLQALLT